MERKRGRSRPTGRDYLKSKGVKGITHATVQGTTDERTVGDKEAKKESRRQEAPKPLGWGRSGKKRRRTLFGE